MDEVTRCHCSREARPHENGNLVCTGCDKFTDSCNGKTCPLGGDEKGRK